MWSPMNDGDNGSWMTCEDRVELLVDVEDEVDAKEIVEIVQEECEERKKMVKDEVGRAITEDQYTTLPQQCGSSSAASGISFEDVELFDSLFTTNEKVRLLDAMESQRPEAVFDVLRGQKMYFIRSVTNNMGAFKYFLMCQLCEKDRRKFLGLLRQESNSDAFVKYLERDVMSVMKGTRVMDFEKMCGYDSTHVVRGRYPSGSKTVYEDGIETVTICGSKREVEFDCTPPVDVRELLGDGFKLNHIQSVVQKSVLGSDDNVLVCAPTGSGKTMIGAFCILREIKRKERVKVAYVAPMKALVGEICKEFVSLFSKYKMKVVEQTSDIHIPYSKIHEANIIVCTPEKLDVVTRSRNVSFGLVVIDEIHLLGECRGAAVEAVVARMLMGGKCRMVGFSGTLPNYRDIGVFIRCKEENMFWFGPEFRRSAIDYEVVKVGEREREMAVLIEKVLENIESGGPVLVFVHSRSETVTVGREVRKYVDRVKFGTAGVELIKEPEVKELVKYGVGIHHGGLSRRSRDTIEEMYRKGDILVLVSTATLAWGVNLPGKTVIIKGSEVYRAELSSWMPLGQTDIMQMFGRAGRFGDDRCKGILISSKETEFLVQKKIESRLLGSICDCLNVEIVRGVSRFEDAVNWFKHTFYYTRLIEENREPGRMMNEIIYSALRHLEDAGLALLSPEIRPTLIGRISSRYCIHYRDAQRLFNRLRPLMLESTLFSVVGDLREFRNLKVDEEEVERVVESTPIPTDSLFGKLVQCYVSNRNEAQTTALRQNGPRVFGGVFEIAVCRGLGISKTILGWYKSVVHRIFPYQTPLRHFVRDKKAVEELEMKEVPFGMLDVLGKSGLDEIGIDGDSIISGLRYVPRFRIVPDIYASKPGLAIIGLEIEKIFDDDGMTSDLYYLFVTDSREERLLVFDTMTFRRESSYASTYYTVAAGDSPFLNICLLSSHYLCPTEPTIVDLRDAKNTGFSVFSSFWREWVLGMVDRSTGSRICLGLFHDDITTSDVVVPNEAESRRLAAKGYKAYTYEEFISQRMAADSVTIMDVHGVSSNHLVEACIVHCIVNRIKMVLVGLPFTDSGGLELIGEIEDNQLGSRSVSVYGSLSTTYYNQLDDYRIELVSNINRVDVDGTTCLVICPTMRTVAHFAQFFENSKVATEYSVVKDGVYFVTKNTVDLWMERRWSPKVDCIHVVETSYYDHECLSFADYSLTDVKRYSLLAPKTFLYVRRGKAMFYFNNGDIPLYYNTSGRKELLVYSHWLGHPSPAETKHLPFIDKGLTLWGEMLCKYSVSMDTMDLFMQNTKDKMGLKNILSLVCSAGELLVDMNSDDFEHLSKLQIDMSRGRAYALTMHLLGGNRMDSDIFEHYSNTILPVMHRLYLCLMEVSLCKSYLKTAFNSIFGLQNLMKIFVRGSSKFYSVELSNHLVSIDVSSMPATDTKRRIMFFLLTDSGGLETVCIDKPGTYTASWRHGVCHVLCDCYPGFETVGQELV